MKSLVIVAHGSRIKAANDEINALAEKMERSPENGFQFVKPAFLEMGGPTAADQIEDLVQRGIRQIVIFPYFLAGGKHVKVDLPELVQQAEKRYPEVDFELVRHLGGFRKLAGFILGEI